MMKKSMLIFGILFLIPSVLSLLYAALNWFAFTHTLDGSGSFYQAVHARMILFLIIGIVLGVAGVALLLLRKRM